MTLSETRIDSHRWKKHECERERERERERICWQIDSSSWQVQVRQRSSPRELGFKRQSESLFPIQRQRLCECECVFAIDPFGLPVRGVPSGVGALKTTCWLLLFQWRLRMHTNENADEQIKAVGTVGHRMGSERTSRLTTPQCHFISTLCRHTRVHTLPLLNVECAAWESSAATEHFLFSLLSISISLLVAFQTPIFT